MVLHAEKKSEINIYTSVFLNFERFIWAVWEDLNSGSNLAWVVTVFEVNILSSK